MTKENRDAKLMKNLMDHYHEKLMDHLVDKIFFENIYGVKDYSNPMLSVMTLISIGPCNKLSVAFQACNTTLVHFRFMFI